MSVDILLATSNNLPALIVTLSGIAGQSMSNFRLIVSDASQPPAREAEVVRAMLRIIVSRGATVTWLERRGFDAAREPEYLLSQATGESVLLLEDTVWMSPNTLQTLLDTMQAQQCGFVGAQPDPLVDHNARAQGGRYLDLWEGSVQPEAILPGQREWQRERVNQNNTFSNLSLRVPRGQQYLYKVAHVSGAVLYHRQRLIAVGGFAPVGADSPFPTNATAAQNRLMQQYGGCSLLPSGVYRTAQPPAELDHIIPSFGRETAPQQALA